MMNLVRLIYDEPWVHKFLYLYTYEVNASRGQTTFVDMQNRQ